jgi:hypothetical protein
MGLQIFQSGMNLTGTMYINGYMDAASGTIETAGGLGITLAWGLPYLQRYIPRLGKSSYHFAAGTAYPDYLPIDHRASQAAGKTVHAILDAMIFPSDQPPPGFPGIVLEANDVAVLLRSDSPAHIQAGMEAL